jgi:hypothetical protein
MRPRRSHSLPQVCKNPRNPGFNHYLFESVAALIKQSTAADASTTPIFEEMLFPAFELVLQQDVQVGVLVALPLQAGLPPAASSRVLPLHAGLPVSHCKFCSRLDSSRSSSSSSSSESLQPDSLTRCPLPFPPSPCGHRSSTPTCSRYSRS